MVNKKCKKRKQVIRCIDCECFNGINPSPSGDDPAAFCLPPGETFAKDCDPYEVAIGKPCFVSSKKGR